MRVVYVCADRGIPLAGHKGASVHVRSITAALQRRGHEVTLLARNLSGTYPRPAVQRIDQLEAEPSTAQDQISRAIADASADAVIERYSLESGPARRASRDCGVPLVIEINSPLVAEAQRHRGLTDPGARRRERQTLRSADVLQVVSPALLQWVQAIAPAVPSACVPNGVDLTAFRDAPPSDVDGLGAGPVVGFVGSMKPWHGVADLIEAFRRIYARIPGASLLLVGGGPLYEHLRHQTEADGLAGTVVLTGPVDHAEVPALIKRMTVAVAPYLPQTDFYFQPLKVVEYLAAGVPVIYSDQGHLADVVGLAGAGYPAGSVDALADRLLELLTDPDRLRRMAAATTAAAAHSDWDQVADRVAGLARDAKSATTTSR